MSDENEDMQSVSESDSKQGSTCIRDELGDVLNTLSKSFTGAFALHKPCPDAPYPGVNFGNRGILSLPLTTQDLEAIKTNAIDGKPEDNGSIWYIDPKTVSLRDPSWSKFMDSLVDVVCGAFGLECKDDAFEYELSHFVLRTPSEDSHTLKVDTRSGTLALMAVTLPYEFVGGSICISQDDISTVYDWSLNSSYCTSAVAWRAPKGTNVVHHLQPVTKGHQVMLVYTLRHLSTCRARHAHIGFPDLATGIRDVLKSWTDIKFSQSPGKLVALLQHAYPKETLQAGKLKDNDAYLFQVLNTLVGQLGFNVGLIHVEIFYGGAAYSRTRQFYGHDEEYDGERAVYMGPLVYPDGTVIKQKLGFNEAEFIPKLDIARLTEECSSDRDDEDCSSDRDDEECSSDRDDEDDDGDQTFNRTAVVIWPKNKTLSLLYDGASLAHTCEELVNTTTPEVNHLIELIVARAGENPTVAWNSLCGVASRRNDAALWKHWTKSLSASHGIAGLSGQNVIDAIRLFGWAALCPTLEDIVHEEESRAQKLCLLAAIRKLSIDLDDTAEVTKLQRWLTDQTTLALSLLDDPLPPPEVTTFMDAIRDLRCAEDLTSLILQKVMDTATAQLDPQRRQQFIEKVVRPLLGVLGEGDLSSANRARVQELQRAAIDLTLDFMDTHSDNSNAEDTIVALLELTSDPMLLSDVIWPRLETMNLASHSLKTLATQLRSRYCSTVEPTEAAQSVQVIVQSAAQQYSTTVLLDTTWSTQNALQSCVEMGAPRLCADIIQRCIVTADTSVPYLRHALVPMLPWLPSFGSRIEQDFSASIKAILTSWNEKVVQPITSQDKVAQLVHAFSRWSCKCKPCSTFHRWLVEKDETTLTVEMPQKKHNHTAEILRMHAGALVAIEILPRFTGVKVTRLEGSPPQAEFKELMATWTLTKTVLDGLSPNLATPENLLGQDLYSSLHRLLHSTRSTPSKAVATSHSQDGPVSKKRKVA